jgi:hypothetical protein
LAHKGHKLQFEIVAVLGLLALFTHIHAFWVAGLLLALIDLPDFGTPLGRIAGSLEKIADRPLDAASPATKSRLTPDEGAFRGRAIADAPPAGDDVPRRAEKPDQRDLTRRAAIYIDTIPERRQTPADLPEWAGPPKTGS